MVLFYTPDAHKLARYWACRYHADTNDLEDIKSEATLGLIRAVEKYDGEHISGAHFITYASYWIKSYVRRFIKWRKSGPATISRGLGEQKDPPRSYGQSIETSESDLFIAGVYDKINNGEIENQNQLDYIFEIAKRKLNKRHYHVFEMRARGFKLDKIAMILNVTRQRVQQMQADSIERLKIAVANEHI